MPSSLYQIVNLSHLLVSSVSGRMGRCHVKWRIHAPTRARFSDSAFSFFLHGAHQGRASSVRCTPRSRTYEKISRGVKRAVGSRDIKALNGLTAAPDAAFTSKLKLTQTRVGESVTGTGILYAVATQVGWDPVGSVCWAVAPVPKWVSSFVASSVCYRCGVGPSTFLSCPVGSSPRQAAAPSHDTYYG